MDLGGVPMTQRSTARQVSSQLLASVCKESHELHLTEKLRLTGQMALLRVKCFHRRSRQELGCKFSPKEERSRSRNRCPLRKPIHNHLPQGYVVGLWLDMNWIQITRAPGGSSLTLPYPTSKEQATLNSPPDSATWSAVGKELDLSALWLV